MAIEVTYLDGPRAGMSEMIDELDSLSIGRSPERCKIQLPIGDSRVGREHCELRRKAGRYRLLLNRDHPVWVDGEPARDDYELPVVAVLQLGEGGPRMRIALKAADDPDRSHTVRMAKPSIGKITEIHHKLSGAQYTATRGRRTAEGVLVALILCLTGIVYLHLGLKNRLAEAQSTSDAHEEQLTRAQRELQLTRDALAQAKSQLTETRSRLDATEQQVAMHANEMERQIAELTKHAQSMSETLRLAQPSVYLVLAYDSRQQPVGMATAWVYDHSKGLLATNAHVARLFGRDGVNRMIVRSMAANLDTAPRDHTVLGVVIHPGYELFPKLVAQCAEGISDRSIATQMNKLTGACDVALLRVADPEALAPALKLATREKLGRAGSGDAVAYIGYPSDLVGGFDFRFPTPLMQVGTIVTLTDFFLMPIPSGDGQLVQVSMPAVGGASGSPVLNAQGEVVATMSSVQASRGEDGKHRVDYKGVNFAQRVDLYAELADMAGDFAAALQVRWEESFRRHFVQTFDDAGLEGFRRDLIDQWSTQIPYVGYRLETVIDEAVTSDRMESEAATRVVDRQLDAGQYLLYAVAPDKRNVDAVAKSAEKVLTITTGAPRFFAIKPFELGAASSVQIALTRRGAQAPFTARMGLLRVIREKSTSELRIAKRDILVRFTQGRLAGHVVNLIGEVKDLRLDQRVGGKQFCRHAATVTEPGHYLAIAISHGDEDIDLAIRDAGRNEQATDDEADSFPAAIVKDVPAGGKLEVIIAAPAGPSVTCTLWLYRCSAPN